jgi:hypothetical protein
MDGDELMLRWMDGSVTESFRMSRRHVALKHPGGD